jgi:hypothetical protein
MVCPLTRKSDSFVAGLEFSLEVFESMQTIGAEEFCKGTAIMSDLYYRIMPCQLHLDCGAIPGTLDSVRRA